MQVIDNSVGAGADYTNADHDESGDNADNAYGANTVPRQALRWPRPATNVGPSKLVLPDTVELHRLVRPLPVWKLSILREARAAPLL